jgi:Ca2+-binding RTX toxin-like protein
MRRVAAVLVFGSVLGAAPGVASASTVRVDPATGHAVYVGGGRPNDVTMDTSRRVPGSPFAGPALSFIDGAQQLSAGAGCVAGSRVWCEARHADVGLNGADDRYDGFSDGDLRVAGGTGDDHIRANGISTSVTGGSGADWIAVGSDGYGAASGDSGDDNIRSFSDGSIAILSGGSGDDLAYGERPQNDVSGDTGDDDLVLGGFAPSGTVTGGSGKDLILVSPDQFGGGGQHTLSGRSGDDTIVGRLGTDTVSGGSGRDVIAVSGDAGQEPDSVNCGSGEDTVYADADDVVADDCENRLNGPMPASKRVNAARARLAHAFRVTIAG